jgi:ferrous iron transport protein B
MPPKRSNPRRKGALKVALIGQPNCGKSTLFNAVAGYRSATGNFSGTTVRLAWSEVRVNGHFLELVDVPGIYSFTANNPTEWAAKKFLLEADVDVIVNVLDASLLCRSLELTLELRELGLPMVVCLNMMDEAERKGITISSAKLSELLGLPVVETIAYRGVGVQQLFRQVLKAAGRPPLPSPALRWHRDVVSVVELMQTHLENGNAPHSLPPSFIAVKLLEGDEAALPAVAPQARAAAEKLRKELEDTHGRPPEDVIMSERHDRAMRLFEQVATIGKPRSDIRVMLDRLLTHPVWGYAILALLLVGFFWGVFGFGAAVEQTMQGALDSLFARWSVMLAEGTLVFAVAKSFWDGIAGGAAVLLPYLVPFLFGLALLEDVGYLPRVAYLLDGLLHRIGLHGTSVLPIVLGYGCSVPACLATRVLPSRRDRFLATVLATLVPCSARTTVIFALVAFYLGPGWALGIYGFNAIVVFFSGWVLARLWPEVSPGMILEVPRYQWPSLRVISKKVWLRLREFILVSWPILIAGSVVLGLAEFWHLDRYVNLALSPLTALLGLPAVVGTTLIFGVLRKELSMLMLIQALGTTAVASVMSPAQILVFTIFITFYIPCLATIVAMTKEIGRKLTWATMGYSFVLATLLATAARFLLENIL